MQLELTVPSMVCDGCVDSVKKAIAKQDSDAKVEVNLETKKVVVETDASATAIKDSITEIGHTVN